jgi:hypothetical protein
VKRVASATPTTWCSCRCSAPPRGTGSVTSSPSSYRGVFSCNYVWNLGVVATLNSGGLIDEVDRACRHIKDDEGTTLPAYFSQAPAADAGPPRS